MNKNRVVFLILVILMFFVLGISIFNRLDRPKKMTSSDKNAKIEFKFRDNQGMQRIEFVDGVMILQTDTIVVEFTSDDMVEKAQISIQNEDMAEEYHSPVGGITKEMQRSGNYQLIWKLPNLPDEGILIIRMEINGKQEAYQMDFISSIPDLKGMFIRCLEVFNLELDMENLSVGDEGEIVEVNGTSYVRLNGTNYHTLSDMSKAVSALFSEKYIEEYHGFFEDYYYFFNSELYKVPTNGKQSIPKIAAEDIQELSYEKVKQNKCVLKCQMSDGYYLLEFCPQGSVWRLDKFSYHDETQE